LMTARFGFLDLRVTLGSVRRWQSAWRDRSAQIQGPVSREKLSPQRWARLELELRRARWRTGSLLTSGELCAGSTRLSAGLFHVGYTPEGCGS